MLRAAGKSNKTRAVDMPFDNEVCISFFIKRRAVSLEWPVLHADCKWLARM